MNLKTDLSTVIDMYRQKFSGNHDLSLPDWGPYSKKLFGISHLADKDKGARFDLSVLPGINRRPLAIPDAGRHSGYLPWETSIDLNYYSYRQQIEWKDKIYCDISFSKLTENSRLMRCQCVNNSRMPVPFTIHLLSRLYYPSSYETVMNSKTDAVWLDALKCSNIHFAVPGIRNGISQDAMRRGQELNLDCINGGCIGQGFGVNEGDSLEFEVPSTYIGKMYKVLLRYCFDEESKLAMEINGICTVLNGAKHWQEDVIFQGKIDKPEIIIRSLGGCSVKIDGLILFPDAENVDIEFKKHCFDTHIIEPVPIRESA